MVAPLITSQVIRYVTERVIENLNRQAARGEPAGEAGGLTDLAVVARLNSQIDAINSRLDALDSRLGQIDSRVQRAESKVGWQATIRLILGVVAGILLGYAGAILTRLLGINF